MPVEFASGPSFCAYICGTNDDTRLLRSTCSVSGLRIVSAPVTVDNDGGGDVDTT